MYLCVVYLLEEETVLHEYFARRQNPGLWYCNQAARKEKEALHL